MLLFLLGCVDVALHPYGDPTTAPPIEVICEGWGSTIGPLELVAVGGDLAEYGRDPYAYTVICDRKNIVEHREDTCIVFAGVIVDRTLWCWETP